jgi:hypothetical protein
MPGNCTVWTTIGFAEPNRYGRRYRFALTQNIIEMLAGDAEQLCDLGFWSCQSLESHPPAAKRQDGSGSDPNYVWQHGE